MWGRGLGLLGRQGTVSLDVAASRGRTHPRAILGLVPGVVGGHEGHPGLADPPDAARRDADDERVGGNVSGNDGTRADRCPRADAHGGHAHGARADGCSTLDGDADAVPVARGLQGAVGIDRARSVIVRQDGRGADKYAVGEGGGLVDERVVLDLAARSDPHAFADVGATSDDRLIPDARVLAHLGEVPDARAGSDDRTGGDVGAGLDHWDSLSLSACARARIGALRALPDTPHYRHAPIPMCDTNQMQIGSDTWVVIPAYNEASVIGGVVAGVRTFFPRVLVVDDASGDDTAAVARAAGAYTARHPLNLGQGAALQTGFDAALARGAQYVVTFDADGQHDPAEAAAMVERARREDLAFVLGSRFLSGSPSSVGRVKRAVLRLGAWVARLRTGLDLTDTHNGLRVIRADALTHVHLTHARMAHASQIVSQLAACGLPGAEHAVTISYTDYSRAKGQPLLNSVNIVVDLALGGR